MCVGHVRLRYLVAGTNWGTEVVRRIFPCGPGVHKHMRGFPSVTATSSNHWPSNKKLPMSPDLWTQKKTPNVVAPKVYPTQSFLFVKPSHDFAQSRNATLLI